MYEIKHLIHFSLTVQLKIIHTTFNLEVCCYCLLKDDTIHRGYSLRNYFYLRISI